MTLKISKDPIPRDNGPVQCDWLDNAIVRINEHFMTLGVVAADKAKFIDWCTMAKDACLGLSNAVTSADAWREYREDLLYGSTVDNAPLTRPADNSSTAPLITELLLPGAMSRIRDFLQGLKRKQAWSTAIEADFRVTPITVEVDVDTAKPEGTAKGMAGADVNLAWVRGPFDGVVIEWQLFGAPAWNSLGTITGSRYTHTAALAVAGQPERRNYRFRFVLNNKQVGEWSDTLPVTVRP
jgi:hypothetical protein